MKVLVTGASGFLGHAVCAALRERGHDTVALVRRPGSEPAGTTPVTGDLTDAASLAGRLAETQPDAVIHLAAEIATQKDPQRIHEVNVAGMQRLLDACLAANSPRVVFTSTVVTGDARGALLDEQTDLPVETAYGRSKQEGERLLHASPLDGVVIRPSHVYGPGGWFVEQFVTRLRQPGRFAVIGSGDNWWDVVHVDDVATACVLAAERAPTRATYHVVDDEPVRYYDFVALAATALGTGRPRRIPAAVARLVAGADPVLAVTRSAKSSNAKIKQELGWLPRFPTARAGVPDAVARLQESSPVPETKSHAPLAVVNRTINPLLHGLLRSPLHYPLSSKVALISVTGRKTGRVYTLPVFYDRDGDSVEIVVGWPERKRWWRNLRTAAPVRMVLRGTERVGHAQAHESAKGGVTVTVTLEPKA